MPNTNVVIIYNMNMLLCGMILINYWTLAKIDG